MKIKLGIDFFIYLVYNNFVSRRDLGKLMAESSDGNILMQEKL